jgi:hypothetical protein
VRLFLLWIMLKLLICWLGPIFPRSFLFDLLDSSTVVDMMSYNCYVMIYFDLLVEINVNKNKNRWGSSIRSKNVIATAAS